MLAFATHLCYTTYGRMGKLKTYTVNEIAERLQTNPETVRRWIRLGKLKSEQTSRKNGNVVSEQAMLEFLKTNSKYAGIWAGTAAAMGTVGISGFVGAIPFLLLPVIGSIIKQKKLMNELINKSQIPKQEIIKYINDSILDCKKRIALKEEEIQKINQEIEEEQKQIQQYMNILEDITFE